MGHWGREAWDVERVWASEEGDDVDRMGRCALGMEWKRKSQHGERVSRRHAGVTSAA